MTQVIELDKELRVELEIAITAKKSLKVVSLSEEIARETHERASEESARGAILASLSRDAALEIIGAEVESPRGGNQYLRQTQNHMGQEILMRTVLIDQFLKASPGKIVLDVGCAFGANTFLSLEGGAAQVMSIDLDPLHLKNILTEADESNLDRILLSTGRLPDRMELASGSFDVILVSHVLHYLNPAQIRESLARLHSLLKSGGELFIQSLSIEAEPYADVREAGLARIAAKEEWPTYFEDIRPGQRVGRMPRMGHPQDLTVLVRELKVAGFEVRVTYAYNFLLKQGISLKKFRST